MKLEVRSSTLVILLLAFLFLLLFGKPKTAARPVGTQPVKPRAAAPNRPFSTRVPFSTRSKSDMDAEVRTKLSDYKETLNAKQ